MKILIFGGAGFVGRHYTKFFLEKNNEVLVIDNLAKLTGGIHPSKWKLFNPYKYKKKFKFINQDCKDYFDKTNKKFNLVINLAAIVGGREVIESNPLAVAEDLEIDSAFWRWAINCRHDHIITYSSSAAYPIDLQRKNKFRLLSEKDINFSNKIGVPDMSYGWAKLTNEYLAKIAYHKYGVKNSVFRPFSGYGFDQDLAYPFPSIIKRAISHKANRDFIVWGTGRQKRDFIHVSDCVEGSIKISKKIKDGSAVNLSTGKFTNFITLAKIALEICGKTNVKIFGNSNKPEGVFARAGCTRMQKKFGFKPKISIKKGIKEAILKQT